MPHDLTLHDKYNRQLSALKVERETFDEHWRSLAEFISPRRGRFLRQERNRGGRSWWNSIINSQATWALRVATAGIFNGIMSPSRPWLMLETDDPDLLEFGPVKEYFFVVQERMRRVFNGSNLYNMAPVMIMEELLFATGCMSHEDDPRDLARFYTHTAGSYYIAQNDRFVVDTVFREFERTVGQIVSQWSRGGEVNKNISQAVRDQYDRGNYHTWYPVVHAVQPNEGFRLGSLKASEKRFESVYYEPGQINKDTMLSRKGFEEFPFYCPRWAVANEDVYGTNCPAMTALGDVRQLQLQERRKAQGIDKMVSPALHGPAVLRNQPVSNLPGGGTFYDAPGAQNVLRPVHEVRLPIEELSKDMQRVEDRINRAFLLDLFLAISAMEGVQPRNQLELTQRNQERLLQLGPTLERQFGDFLDPLVSRTFNQMNKAGLLPPAPEVLQTRPLKPRYVSSLAMAQQAVSTGTLDRLVGFTGQLLQLGLSDGKKFDGDQAIDEYATVIGSPPRVIVPDDVVAQRREAEAQVAAEDAQLVQDQQVASIAKTAGDTKVDENSLAGRIVGQ